MLQPAFHACGSASPMSARTHSACVHPPPLAACKPNAATKCSDSYMLSTKLVKITTGRHNTIPSISQRPYLLLCSLRARRCPCLAAVHARLQWKHSHFESIHRVQNKRMTRDDCVKRSVGVPPATGYVSLHPMARCVVHALKGLACHAPGLFAHNKVTKTHFFNGSKTWYLTVLQQRLA